MIFAAIAATSGAIAAACGGDVEDAPVVDLDATTPDGVAPGATEFRDHQGRCGAADAALQADNPACVPSDGGFFDYARLAGIEICGP